MQGIPHTKWCNTNPKHTICDPSQIPTGDFIFRRDALYATELMGLKSRAARVSRICPSITYLDLNNQPYLYHGVEAMKTQIRSRL